jgi:hypothetical protein
MSTDHSIYMPGIYIYSGLSQACFVIALWPHADHAAMGVWHGCLQSARWRRWSAHSGATVAHLEDEAAVVHANSSAHVGDRGV